MDLCKDYECELKLSNPLTEEEWDSLTDVDMEHTSSVEFTTKHGQKVRYIKERHGRWIKMTGMMPPEYHGHYECSECQWHMKGIRSSWTREEELDYCPNCGAKMDGGNDGTDQ